MRPEECRLCQWFYTRTYKGYTEHLCTYSFYHSRGVKFVRMVNIKRKKSCKRKEVKL